VADFQKVGKNLCYECMIVTGRLCHIKWSRKWHNLPPPQTLIYRGRPFISAYPFIKIEIHYYKDRPNTFKWSLLHITLQQISLIFFLRILHVIISPASSKQIMRNIPGQEIVIGEVPPNYTRIVSWGFDLERQEWVARDCLCKKEFRVSII